MKKLLTACILGFNLLGGGIFAQQENVIPEVGRVGIGTLNPSAKLDVNGHVRIDSTLLIKDSILIEKDARVQEDLKVEGQLYLPNTTSIGTYSDETILTKDGNGLVKSFTVSALNDVLYSKVCPTDPNEDILSPTWSNGLNKIYTDCPKINVGIGTMNPRVKLDVIGTSQTTRFAINQDPLNMVGWFHMNSKIPTTNTATVLLIENLDRKLFQINNDGIVRVEEILVQPNEQWPDYVFKKDYNLPTLEETSKFIQQNGHLPNIPSAAEIKEEGIALGEMNRLLLEKVEELTLHLIQQDKRIHELEKQLQTKGNEK